MKVFRTLFALMITLLVTGCLDNNLVEPFDCNMSNLAIQLQADGTNCGLSEGQIEVTVTGGEAPFMYSINNGTPQSTSTFTDLAAGDYTIKVTDANDCERTGQASVSNLNGINVSSVTMPSACDNDTGKIVITASGGAEPYSYKLGSGAAQSSNEFTVGAGEFVVTTTDNNGCSFESTIQVLSTTSYANDVSPIIMSSCATTNCHDGSVSSRPNFTQFSVVQATASQIKSRTQNGSMPPNGTLSQAQKDAIACWVDDGALDN